MEIINKMWKCNRCENEFNTPKIKPMSFSYSQYEVAVCPECSSERIKAIEKGRY